jgi:hypothetical protein
MRPEPRDWAEQQGIPTSFDVGTDTAWNERFAVRSLFYPDDLARHCRKLDREANLAIEETGANMLFLVLGFLEYPDQQHSEKNFGAPLICIPVSLVRRDSSGQQSFAIQYTGDDIAENLSLREKLRNDHSILLPEIAEDDPLDVDHYLSEIRRIVAKRPGFQVRNWVSLCLLSFTNMLLVRDLDPENWPTLDGEHSLLDHPIVRKVFEGTAEESTGASGEAPIQDVEGNEGDDIPLIYNALLDVSFRAGPSYSFLRRWLLLKLSETDLHWPGSIHLSWSCTATRRAKRKC